MKLVNTFLFASLLAVTSTSLFADWQSGLRGGAVAGYQNYAGTPVVSYVRSGPNIVTNRYAELVPLNTTWAYTGQIYLNGGPYRFGYAMYTYIYLRINSTVYLNTGYANNLSSVIELPAGWYDFDLRVTHSYSTGVPSGANNWPLNLGFGMTTNRNATASGTFFSYPQDPGDMSLFRCTTGLLPATNALLVRGNNGYDNTPNLPAPYLISPLAPGDTVAISAPTNHFSTATKMYVRCIGYDLLTNGVLQTSGTGTSLAYTHNANLPELVWKWRRDNLGISWSNAAGGDFRNPGNWNLGIVPERSDVAIFDIASPPYTVTWSGNSTSLYFKVNSGTVTWNLQGKTYFFQNTLTTEYGSTLFGACTFGTTTTPVDMLITNGTVNFIATKDTYSKIYNAGTKVRLHDAKLTLQYVELVAGALVHASGPTALFRSYGYTAGIFGTIISTNGALHDSASGIKLRTGSLCVLSAASGGRTHTTALTILDSGSELRLLDGAKVSSTYIGTTPLQRTRLFGKLTLLGSGSHLWDVYNSTPAYIPTLSVEAQGRVQGSGKLEFTYVENAGQIWPGGSNSVGTLEIKGNMTNRNEGTIVMELAGPTQYDQISVTKGALTGIGKLWAGGTLSVNLLGTFKPVYDDTFKLFSFVAAASTPFNTLSLPGGKAKWDTSKLYTEGIIRYAVPPGTLFLVR